MPDLSLNCTLDGTGERFCFSRLDTLKHNLMTLDDVIEDEMTDVGVSAEFRAQTRA